MFKFTSFGAPKAPTQEKGPKNPENTVEGYVAATLDQESHDRLLKYMPEEHVNAFAHHMTIWYKPPQGEYERMQREGFIGSEMELHVRQIVSNDKCVAARLSTEGMTEFMQNEHPHVTISTADGTYPVYSNELLTLPAEEVDTIHTNFTIKAYVKLEEFPKNEIK